MQQLPSERLLAAWIYTAIAIIKAFSRVDLCSNCHQKAVGLIINHFKWISKAILEQEGLCDIFYLNCRCVFLLCVISACCVSMCFYIYDVDYWMGGVRTIHSLFIFNYYTGLKVILCSELWFNVVNSLRLNFWKSWAVEVDARWLVKMLWNLWKPSLLFMGVVPEPDCDWLQVCVIFRKLLLQTSYCRNALVGKRTKIVPNCFHCTVWCGGLETRWWARELKLFSIVFTAPCGAVGYYCVMFLSAADCSCVICVRICHWNYIPQN